MSYFKNGINFSLLGALGVYFIKSIELYGKILIFFIKSVYHCITPPFYFKMLLRQVMEIGFLSLPLVCLTSSFTGASLIMQNSFNEHSIMSSRLMPGILLVSIIKELGPVLIGIILAGRVGASIAAEIGYMRITEQIDAMITLNTDPFKYLVTPRILAMFIVMPVLTLCADLWGIFGGYVVGTLKLDYNPSIYISHTMDFFYFKDVFWGMLKTLVFGFIVVLISCYNGYYCYGGASGVGKAATTTIVFSSMFIILLNYIVTYIYSG